MSTTLKNKVIAKLEKLGNNPQDVQKMVSIHFEQAIRMYSNVKSISEFIRTVY